MHENVLIEQIFVFEFIVFFPTKRDCLTSGHHVQLFYLGAKCSYLF